MTFQELVEKGEGLSNTNSSPSTTSFEGNMLAIVPFENKVYVSVSVPRFEFALVTSASDSLFLAEARQLHQ